MWSPDRAAGRAWQNTQTGSPPSAEGGGAPGMAQGHPGGVPGRHEGRTGPAGVPVPVRILSRYQLWTVKSALRLAGVPICAW